MAEVHLMTDKALLECMEVAASRFNHAAFAHYEDALYQRHIRFNLETFPIPFNRRDTIQGFPTGVRERYIEIRKKLYPAENLELPSA